MRREPPDRALVLCVDEKTQVQALDRSRWTKSADEIPRSVKRFCLHTSNSRH
jgi:hypothetical protein